MNGLLASNTIRHLNGNPIRLSLDGLAVARDQHITNFSLEHLGLLQVDTRKDLELLKLENNSIKWTPWSIFGALSITPIIIGLAIFVAILIHRHSPRVEPKQHTSGIPAPRDVTFSIQRSDLVEVIRTVPHH